MAEKANIDTYPTILTEIFEEAILPRRITDPLIIKRKDAKEAIMFRFELYRYLKALAKSDKDKASKYRTISLVIPKEANYVIFQRRDYTKKAIELRDQLDKLRLVDSSVDSRKNVDSMDSALSDTGYDI